MTDLTVASWDWGQFAWSPVPVFIEVEGVLFSWERTHVGDISGWLGPWSEGYIHIENAEISGGEIQSFSVIVNERSYFLPEGMGHIHEQTLLRLTFVREGGVLKIGGIEEVSHPYSYRFEMFVTFGCFSFATDFLYNADSALVFFGDETCDATLDIIDKVIALSITTGQTIYYFNLNRFAFAFDIPLFHAALEELNVTAATALPKLIYVHEFGFDVVYSNGGIDRLGEFLISDKENATSYGTYR